MLGRTLQITYPNGDFEIELSQKNPAPAVGDRLRRRRKLWKVTHATGSEPVVVRVELVPERSPENTAR